MRMFFVSPKSPSATRITTEQANSQANARLPRRGQPHPGTIPWRISIWLTPNGRTDSIAPEFSSLPMIRPTIKTEIFVCDQCGSRKRLRTAARHWCDVCKQGSPVEMRPTRVKLGASRLETDPTREVRQDRF
jgi:hypothetical protein